MINIVTCDSVHAPVELNWSGDALGHPLFDAHVHVGASDTGQIYYGHLTGPEYHALAEKSGLTGALIFPPQLDNGYREANLALAAWCRSVSSGIRALARVGGKRIGWTEPYFWLLRRKLRRAIGLRAPDLLPEELDQFAGVKLLPHLDGLPSDAFFEAINNHGLPVLTHGGKFVDADFIEKSIVPKAQGPVIIAHLGAFPDREADLKAAVALAQRHPRVYLDTSGVWIADFLRYAAERIPEKLIFGSDCPLTHPRVAWEFVAMTVKSDETLENIAYKTAHEVYGSC